MVLDYSKFERIGDSDEDQPDPKVLQEADRRRQLAEEFKAQLSSNKVPELPPEALEGGLALARAAQEAAITGTVEPFVNLPAHKVDRFAHSDQDITDIAQESLRLVLSKQSGITTESGGVLSLAAIEAIEGDATIMQLQGATRYVYDFNIDLKVAFKWLGQTFDGTGMQRVEGRLELEGVSSELLASKTPVGRDNKECPTTARLYWPPNQQALLQQEEKLQSSLEGAIGVCSSLPSKAESKGEGEAAAAAAAAPAAPCWRPPSDETFLGQVFASLRRWAGKLPDVVEGRLEERRQKFQTPKRPCH